MTSLNTQHDDAEDKRALLSDRTSEESVSHGHQEHDNADENWDYARTREAPEYTELEVDDSETTPLSRTRERPDDEDSADEDEPKVVYRLPNEGGSIFASFVGCYTPG